MDLSLPSSLSPSKVIWTRKSPFPRRHPPIPSSLLRLCSTKTNREECAKAAPNPKRAKLPLPPAFPPPRHPPLSLPLRIINYYNNNNSSPPPPPPRPCRLRTLIRLATWFQEMNFTRIITVPQSVAPKNGNKNESTSKRSKENFPSLCGLKVCWDCTQSVLNKGRAVNHNFG